MSPSSAAHRRVLVTGGAGFIGSCLIRSWFKVDPSIHILCVDKLSYAGNLGSLAEVAEQPSFQFARIDICETEAISGLLAEFRPTAILHLAAESHVDRSIHGPGEFVTANVVGTYSMLEAARGYWNQLAAEDKAKFRFHHISTDEVFGSLGPEGAFSETTPYAPNSPYSATKAASDHLARAWHHTYGLPVVATNCSNNYGPYQFPEKLIPLTILNAAAGKPLPVYGNGANIRDWLYVGDHAEALRLVLERGKVGETYNIGGRAERRNLDVVHGICAILDELRPGAKPYTEQIRFVTDRPGHDQRYAIDCSKIERELGWTPRQTFESGLRETVEWYLHHTDWVDNVQSGDYRKWLSMNYDDRATERGAA